MSPIGRSLRLYHDPERRPMLDRFYARFLRDGDLAFDVGAHVGDRTACFRRLGARVVAVEPQPRVARALRLLFGRDPAVTIVPAMVGAAPGQATLRLNRANPTVATASDAFVAAAATAPGWEGQAWDAAIACPVTTLDALIAAHGLPDFCKIDVEGFEAAALTGLTARPAAISVEFTTIQRDVAFACLRRLEALGYTHFNASLGESLRLAHSAPIAAAAVARWLGALPEAANSGDLYAAAAPECLAGGPA